MNIIAVACAPGVAIALYLFWLDKHDREELKHVISAFFLGILSTIPAGISNSVGIGAVNNFFYPYLLDDTIYHFSNILQAVFVVGGGEELFKFLMLFLFIYPKKYFDEPYDGVLYGALVAVGFATLENVQYSMEGGMQVAVARMFTAVPMHASCGVIMGYYAGLAKFHPAKKTRFLILAWAIPAVLHGFYDYFLFIDRFPQMAIGAMVALFITIRLATQALNIHRKTLSS